jgi:tripartite-type tricarboxylate transporter receptor subunit TctC
MFFSAALTTLKEFRSANIGRLALCGAAFAMASVLSFGAIAQERTLTLVVPYAAGGPTDVLTRVLAESMRATLGQSVIVENIGGAAGMLATGRMHNADPDGSRVIVGNWGTHVINGALNDLPYSLLNDFEPIGLIANNPHVIVSKSSVPATNLKELITWVRENQKKIVAANSGVGSPSHISGLQFQKMTGTEFPFVPYRGSGPAIQDLVGGQIDIYFDQISNSLGNVRSGAIKAYAVASKTRSAAAPDIPTVDEAGLPNFYISVWHGMWAPKGTPKEIISKLNGALVKALADPTVRKRLAELGQEIVPVDQQTPEHLAAFHRAEVEKWWPIIRAAKPATQAK